MSKRRFDFWLTVAWICYGIAGCAWIIYFTYMILKG